MYWRFGYASQLAHKHPVILWNVLMSCLRFLYTLLIYDVYVDCVNTRSTHRPVAQKLGVLCPTNRESMDRQVRSLRRRLAKCPQSTTTTRTSNTLPSSIVVQLTNCSVDQFAYFICQSIIQQILVRWRQYLHSQFNGYVTWMTTTTSAHIQFWSTAAGVEYERCAILLSNDISLQWKLCTRLNPCGTADDATRLVAVRDEPRASSIQHIMRQEWGRLKRPHTWHFNPEKCANVLAAPPLMLYMDKHE